MSEQDVLIVRLAERLAEELSEAFARTPVSVASWVHVRKAYQTSLSLLRLLRRR